LRCAFVSFALYARLIFFPLLVNRFVKPLSDVKAIDHRAGVAQEHATGGVESGTHVGAVGLHPQALRFAQLFQAFAGSRLITPLRHGQDLGLVGMGQVGQDRAVQLVALLQAQFVDADIGDLPMGFDLLGLGISQLVLDNQGDRFGRDAQAASHLLFVAAD